MWDDGGAGVVVAKKKPGESERRPMVLAMRGAPEWKDWLERAATHCGLSVSAFIEVASRKYAQSEGFKEHPPKR